MLASSPLLIFEFFYYFSQAYNLPVKEADMVRAHKKVVKQKKKQQLAKTKNRSWVSDKGLFLLSIV